MQNHGNRLNLFAIPPNNGAATCTRKIFALQFFSFPPSLFRFSFFQHFSIVNVYSRSYRDTIRSVISMCIATRGLCNTAAKSNLYYFGLNPKQRLKSIIPSLSLSLPAYKHREINHGYKQLVQPRDILCNNSDSTTIVLT